MQFSYLVLTLLLLCIVSNSYLLSSVGTGHNLHLNAINKKDKPVDSVPSNEPKIQFKFSDLITLIQMGAGAPSLGEYERTDENGKVFFIFIII